MADVGRSARERTGQATVVFVVLFAWEYLQGAVAWRIPLVVAVAFLVMTLAIDGARRKLHE